MTRNAHQAKAQAPSAASPISGDDLKLVNGKNKFFFQDIEHGPWTYVYFVVREMFTRENILVLYV